MRSVTTFPKPTKYPVATQSAITSLLQSNSNSQSYEITQQNPHASNVFSDFQTAIEHRQKLVILHYIQFITTTQYLKNVLINDFTAGREKTLNNFKKNVYSKYSSSQKAAISRYFECANTYYQSFKAFNSLNLIFDRHIGSTHEEWQPLIILRNKFLSLRHESNYAIKLEVSSIAQLNSLVTRIETFLNEVLATPNADANHSANLENIRTLRAQHTFNIVEYEANFRQLLASLAQNYQISLQNPLDPANIEEITKEHTRALTEVASNYSLQIEYGQQFKETFEPREDFVWEIEQDHQITLDNIDTVAFSAFTEILEKIFPAAQDDNINSNNLISKLREVLKNQNVKDKNDLLKKANDDNFSISNPKLLKSKLAQFLYDIGNEENKFISIASNLHNQTNNRFDNNISIQLAAYWKKLALQFIQSPEINKFESTGRIKNLYLKVAMDANKLYEKLHPPIAIAPEQNNLNQGNVIVGTQAQMAFLGITETYITEVQAANNELVAEADVVRDVTSNLLYFYYSGSLSPSQKKQLGIKIGKALEISGNNAVTFNNTQLHEMMIHGHRESNWAILHAELKRLQAYTHLEKLMASALYEYVSGTDKLLNSQSLDIWDRIHKYFIDRHIKFERSLVVSELIGLIKSNSQTINDIKLFDELKRVLNVNWSSKDSSNSILFKKLKSLVENNRMIFMFSPRQHSVAEQTSNEIIELRRDVNAEREARVNLSNENNELREKCDTLSEQLEDLRNEVRSILRPR